MDLELKLKIFHILNGLIENRNLIRLKIEKKTLPVIRNRNFKARLLNIWNYTCITKCIIIERVRDSEGVIY